MNYGHVSEEFGDMAFEHAWKVFSVLPLKLLSNEDTFVAIRFCWSIPANQNGQINLCYSTSCVSRDSP
jgi:hypothetical protein